MQWLTSVAGSSATPNSRCMKRAAASLKAGDAVVGVAAVLGLVDLLGHARGGRLAAAISSFSPMPKSSSCRSGWSASAFRLARLIFSNL